MDKFEQMLGKVSEDLKPKDEGQKADEPVKQEEDVKAAPPVEEGKPAEAKTDEPKKEDQSEGLAPEKVFGFLDSNEGAYFEYLSKKTGRDIKSLDDLTKVEKVEVEKEPELPEDVKKFWEYKKETGRGLTDFLKANKDWSSESKESVVMEHIRQTEGLDGELLKDFYELNYLPDEDEVSDKERRMAKLRFEQRYNNALGYFKDQQKQFTLPTDDTSGQRQAVQQAEADAKRFQEGMLGALREVQEINIGDFSYKIGNDPVVSDKFSSMEKILGAYKKGDSFDYKALLQTLYAGENATKIAQSYAEYYKNKSVEDDLKKMSNHKEPGAQAPTSEGVDSKRVVSDFRKYF
jgi:hypothetical protein